jgi:hypothetical protein
VFAELARIVAERAALPAKRNMHINIQFFVIRKLVSCEHLFLRDGRVHGNGRIMNGGEEITVEADEAEPLQFSKILNPHFCGFDQIRIHDDYLLGAKLEKLNRAKDSKRSP